MRYFVTTFLLTILFAVSSCVSQEINSRKNETIIKKSEASESHSLHSLADSKPETTPNSTQECIKFVFQFYNPQTKNAKVIEVEVPLNTHLGTFENYHYSAIRKNESFTIKWEIPGWYQIYKNKSEVFQTTYNTIYIPHLSNAPKKIDAYLNALNSLEITLKTENGKKIPDGTIFSTNGLNHSIYNLLPIIQNQIATIYVDGEGEFSIKNLKSNDFFAEPIQAIIKNGDTTRISVDVKELQKININLVDQDNKPLQNYLVAFTKSRIAGNDSLYIQTYYFSNPKVLDYLDLQFVCTNEAGMAEVKIPNFGTYTVVTLDSKSVVATQSISITKDISNLTIVNNIYHNETIVTFFEKDKAITVDLSIELTDANNRESRWSAKKGVLTILGMPNGKYKLEVFQYGYPHIDEIFELEIPLSGVTEKKILLNSGATISGTVLVNGLPLNNFRSTFQIGEKDDFNASRQSNIDTKGHFKFTGLNPLKKYNFVSKFDNYEFDKASLIDYMTSSNEIVLNATSRDYITVKIYGKSGIQVDNFSFSYVVEHEIQKNTLSSSGGGGPLQIHIVPDGKVKLKIICPQYAVQEVAFSMNSLKESRLFEIHLKEGFIVNGIAKDPQNNPINSGYIQREFIYDNCDGGSSMVSSRSNESGKFQIENCTIGDSYFFISNGHPPIPFTIEKTHDTETIILKAIPSYTTKGILKDQFEKPVENIKIIGHKLDSKQEVFCKTDNTGRFTFTSMTPGIWRFEFECNTFEGKHPSHDILIADKDKSFDMTIKTNVTVNGVASDQSNRPINSGYIQREFKYDNSDGGASKVYARTDENGAFQIEDCVVGNRYFLLSKGNPPVSFTIGENNFSEAIILKTSNSYTVSGSLKNQKGKAIANIEIIGSKLETEQKVFYITDNNGNFTFSSMTPGKWQFQIKYMNDDNLYPKQNVEITNKDETFETIITTKEE